MTLKSSQYILVVLSMALFSCAGEQDQGNCPMANALLDDITVDGKRYLLTKEGEAYIVENGICAFFQRYFEADFRTSNYTINDGMTFVNFAGNKVRIKKSIAESFEGSLKFTDLFISSIADTSDNWTDFVAQSPANPTILEYVALRSCIFAGTCSFEDNKIELIQDPLQPSNRVLKFAAVTPSPAMVTSKSSIETSLLFAEKGDEFWFEADYYIASGMPFTLIDLENQWFSESPGIRVIIDSSNSLAVELKYGSKPTFRQNASSRVTFPTNQWVKVKVYFLLDNGSSGKIKLWQNGQLLLDASGQTLPTSNSIQTNLEVGITACGQSTELYVDNISARVVNN